MEPSWFHFFCLKLSKVKSRYTELIYWRSANNLFYRLNSLGFNLGVEEFTISCHNEALLTF